MADEPSSQHPVGGTGGTTAPATAAVARRALLPLFVTVTIDILGFGMVLPLLPLYVDRYGGEPIVAGVLTTSFSAAQFLFAPLWGRASDLCGRRPLILLSLVGSALAFALFGAARSLWVLFAARIAGGILTAASLPTAHAYIADVTSPEHRARGMALIGVAFGVGFSCGPMLGGWLGNRYGLPAPAYAVAAIAVANFVWSWFALPETLPRERRGQGARRPLFFDVQRFRQAYRNPDLGRLLSVFTVTNLGFAMVEATFTWLILKRFVAVELGGLAPQDLLERRAAGEAGKAFLVIGLAAMVTQGAVMGGAARRIGDARLLQAGLVVLGLSLFAIAGAGSLGALLWLSAAMAAGSSMQSPALNSLVSKHAEEGERGSVLGLQQGLGSFARMLAPPLGTWLLQRWTPGLPFAAAAAMVAIAFLASLAVREPEPSGQ